MNQCRSFLWQRNINGILVGIICWMLV